VPVCHTSVKDYIHTYLLCTAPRDVRVNRAGVCGCSWEASWRRSWVRCRPSSTQWRYVWRRRRRRHRSHELSCRDCRPTTSSSRASTTKRSSHSPRSSRTRGQSVLPAALSVTGPCSSSRVRHYYRLKNHLIWPDLCWPHFIWTQCAGCSHGELWSDPVRRGCECDRSHVTQFR